MTQFPTIPELETPALVIDLEAMERNLKRMADYFAPLACKLRPHAKTHKCTEIVRRQIELGAIGITCAKLGEAEVLVYGGAGDILIANQIVSPEKIRRLAELARRCTLTVAVDDLDNAYAIAQRATQVGAMVGVLLEIDVGMGRCGLSPADPVEQFALRLDAIPSLRFRGLMGYEGHTVMVQDPAERNRAATAAAQTLLGCVERVRRAGLDVEIVSAGGTGTYDITSSLEGVTEIQAGSYPLMDARYRTVRPEFENALFLAATVVSRPTPDRVILDCGLKSVSSEFGLPVVVGQRGLEVVHLSEEHARCKAGAGAEAVKPGSQVWLLPGHCCTTVNLHDRYWCVRGGSLADTWPIEARGKSA